MSKTTNINIISGTKIFPYVIQYIPQEKEEDHEMSDDFSLNSEWKRCGEYWSKRTNWNKLWNVKSSQATIRVCFPDFSVETYEGFSDYVLDIYMFIANEKIDLGSYRLNRKDALALPVIFNYQGNIYYEFIDLTIPDPQKILYSDDWSSMRKIIKGVNMDENNDSSTLMFSLHAVDEIQDKLVKKDLYEGGQNAINVSVHESDYLRTSMKYSEGKIQMDVRFNPAYDTIDDYMKETYDWDSVEVVHLLTVDNGEAAPVQESKVDEFELNKKIKKLFSDWSAWKVGMKFISKTILRNGVNEMILTSNTIPITMEMFSKIMLSEKITIPEEMEINNIHVTNNIESPTIQYNIPENSKSNIIIPVFYRVRDLGQVVIHPEVNENICINLDAYKSRVEYFVLQVEGVKFKEIGTVPSGTIFKVIGSSLPQANRNGSFYILDQNGDLVTTGKYIYEV